MSIVIDVPTLPKIADVAKATSIVTKVPLVDLYGERRHKRTVLARFVVWYVARHSLLKSYPVIGKSFNRDHTTVIHGVQKAQAMIEQGQGAVAHYVMEVKAALGLADDQAVLRVIEQWEARAIAQSDPKLRAFAFTIYRDLLRAATTAEAA